jgi:hypothetical protein
MSQLYLPKCFEASECAPKNQGGHLGPLLLNNFERKIGDTILGSGFLSRGCRAKPVWAPFDFSRLRVQSSKKIQHYSPRRPRPSMSWLSRRPWGLPLAAAGGSFREVGLVKVVTQANLQGRAKVTLAALTALGAGAASTNQEIGSRGGGVGRPDWGGEGYAPGKRVKGLRIMGSSPRRHGHRVPVPRENGKTHCRKR